MNGEQTADWNEARNGMARVEARAPHGKVPVPDRVGGERQERVEDERRVDQERVDRRDARGRVRLPRRVAEQQLRLGQHLAAQDGAGHERRDEEQTGAEEGGIAAARRLEPADHHQGVRTISRRWTGYS